jgi:hypothetical protein
LTGGRIDPTYRQPFDVIALMASQAEKEKPADHADQPVLQEWGG